MPQLPNLGALDLRSRVVTKTGTNSSPNPKRQKTSVAQDPDVASKVLQDFLTRRVEQYLGRTPTEQEKQDLIERARKEVARMYAASGLTYDWPDAVGVEQGQALLEGGPADVRRLRMLRVKLWGKGFISLKQQQVSARKDDDRKRKQAMQERERKDKDGDDDGRDHFASMNPETPESPDALLGSELRKKAEGRDPQRWGENLQNFDRDDACCSKR